MKAKNDNQRHRPADGASDSRRTSALSLVVRESLQSQAKEAIVRAILNGLFQPGERVVETSVAEGLGLSRSTVRGAVQALVQEGLLLQEPFKGTIVMPLTARGAEELETIREALEKLAVQRAVALASADEIAELRRRYEAALEVADGSDIGRSYRLDLAMHQQIIAMAHHQLLASHFKLIEPKMLMYMAHAGGPYVTRDSFKRQHEDIVEGIATRDLERALRALDNHFEEATGFLLGMFPEQGLKDRPSGAAAGAR
jgi:DNA-binding GntR family transcriptional regulator